MTSRSPRARDRAGAAGADNHSNFIRYPLKSPPFVVLPFSDKGLKLAMVTIRFSRAGMLKRPFYHIVVTDSRSPRDGRYIERVGYYNPIATGASVPASIKLDRVDYWLSKGAQTSATVANLLKKYRKQAPVASVTV